VAVVLALGVGRDLGLWVAGGQVEGAVEKERVTDLREAEEVAGLVVS